MGPSPRAGDSARALCKNRWLRRQDSNLQSPDPESGALPIWPLLSAALKYNQRESPAPPGPGATLPCRGVAKRLGVTIDQRVASRQQRRVGRVAFDHVAQLAKVVDQQAQASLVLVGRLQSLEQIRHHIFEFRFLDFERDLERAFELD